MRCPQLPAGVQAGILIDEQYGASAAELAAASGGAVSLAMPVEASGEEWFRFSTGTRWPQHAEFFAAEHAKVLVGDNPGLDSGRAGRAGRSPGPGLGLGRGRRARAARPSASPQDRRLGSAPDRQSIPQLRAVLPRRPRRHAPGAVRGRKPPPTRTMRRRRRHAGREPWPVDSTTVRSEDQKLFSSERTVARAPEPLRQTPVASSARLSGRSPAATADRSRRAQRPPRSPARQAPRVRHGACGPRAHPRWRTELVMGDRRHHEEAGGGRVQAPIQPIGTLHARSLPHAPGRRGSLRPTRGTAGRPER